MFSVQEAFRNIWHVLLEMSSALLVACQQLYIKCLKMKAKALHRETRRRVARKHFSSRRKSECELSSKCVVRSVKSSELR